MKTKLQTELQRRELLVKFTNVLVNSSNPYLKSLRSRFVHLTNYTLNQDLPKDPPANLR